MSVNTEHGPHLSFVGHLPLTHAALGFATERHAGQRRPGDGAAFVLHPVEVASLLDRAGYPDHVVAAAVLHDVLENTDVQRSELDARFGREVAELVAAVSEDASIAGEERRKDELRARIGRLGGYPAALYAADKISKVRELRAMLKGGTPRAEVAGKMERHRRSLEVLDATIPGSRLVEALRFELEALNELPPEPGG